MRWQERCSIDADLCRRHGEGGFANVMGLSFEKLACWNKGIRVCFDQIKIPATTPQIAFSKPVRSGPRNYMEIQQHF